MLNNNLKYPLVLILTHRRGVGIAIILDEKKLLNFLNNAEENFLNSCLHDIKYSSNFEYFIQNEVTFTRVIGKTAENLYELYQFSMGIANLSTLNIKTFAVGIGPGSFTGLRLGCAFINGLKIGNPYLNLIPITTLLTADLLNECNEYFSAENCKLQLHEFDTNDESTGYITFYDLYFCLKKLFDENKLAVESLIPEYGKQPGPVLKILEGNKI